MTAMDTTPTAASDQAAARRQEAARDAYRASLAAGVPMSGAELGRRFGRSPRWGRIRVAEARAEAAVGSNGRGPDSGPHTNGAGRDPGGARLETGPASRRARVEGREAESASVSGNGAATASTRNAASTLQLPGTLSPVTPGVRRVTTLAVLAVAFVAAAASYDHQRLLAELAGEGWRAWLLPVSVDGLVVAASMSMLVRRRAGLAAGALAWASLLAGIGASLAANVAAAQPTVVGRFVAAWPPVALLLAWELFMEVRTPAALPDRSAAMSWKDER
jgi:hypothetical protein